MSTTPEEVLITNGGQQAISLLAQMYLRLGEGVVVEDPTYIGAVDAFRATGARMIPVPVRKDGADLVSLGEALLPDDDRQRSAAGSRLRRPGRDGLQEAGVSCWGAGGDKAFPR